MTNGCSSFAFETRAPSVNRIAGVLGVPGARRRGDIDSLAGYLAGVGRYTLRRSPCAGGRIVYGPAHPSPAVAAG